jgi:hypothetical protein
MPVIGFLSGGLPGPYAPFAAAYHRGLKETGYVEGVNTAVEYRWAIGRIEILQRSTPCRSGVCYPFCRKALRSEATRFHQAGERCGCAEFTRTAATRHKTFAGGTI